MDLYPFQREGIQQLIGRRCILLADDMGLGKTVQAAVALKELFQTQSIRRALIVCPVSLSRNWRRELRVWADGIPAVLYEGADRHGMLEGNAPILIGSYESVADDLRRATKDGRTFCDMGIDLIILDEAQRIKDPASIRSRVLARVLAGRRWAITGTPLENHPRELNSILRFLFPNEFLNSEDCDDLALMLLQRDRAMIRRTKAEVGIQLPELLTAYSTVQLTPDQAAEYERTLASVRRSVLNAASNNELTVNLLGGLQNLRRITTVSSNGSSAKLDLIEEEIETLAERQEKVVIFSSFSNIALDHAVQRLSRFRPVRFTGAMTQAEREFAHQRFMDDPRCLVMCASLRAAGVGITWTVARYVYHLDLWWNPQVLRQAEDRLHRIGQECQVIVKRLIAENTIDEGIVTLLETKNDVFRFVVDGDPIATVHRDTLEQLLSLLGARRDDLTKGAARN